MPTTRVRLQTGESRNIEAGTFKVTGGTGSESVTLAAGAIASIDNKVESVTLAGNIADYTFERKGKSVLIKQGGVTVATVAAQTDSDGTSLSFADVTGSLVLSGRDLLLGGATVGRTATSVPAEMAAETPSTGGTPSKSGPELSLSEDNRPVRVSDVSSSSFGSSNSTSIAGLDAFRADSRFASITGSGQTIVVVDTSFDLDHPAFGSDANGDGVADRIVYHADFTPERNGANTTRVNLDDHGTHVASIAGSLASNAPGVAPGANLILLQVLTEDGSGTDNDIEKALQWVVRNGAFYNVVAVNLSLGGSENDTRATSGSFSDEFSALLGLGIVPVVAAGNDYETFQTQGVGYPASDPSALGVAASNNAADQLASFSQRHVTLTETVAPGQNIIGANSGGGTISLSGTSMATPFITGTIALAQQLAQQTLGRRLTASEVTRLINSSGDSFVDVEVPGDDVRNSLGTYSHVDVLDLGAAILALGSGTPSPSPTPTPTPTPTPSPADDAGESAATAGSITLASSLSGSLEQTGDLDWFGIDLTAGSSYTVSLTGVTLRDPYLRVVDAAGNLVIENDDISSSNLNAQATFTAGSSGRFYLVADSYLSGLSGNYTLRAEQLSTGGGSNTPVDGSASTLSGSIGRSGERDLFSAQLVAGTEYVFSLRGSASSGGTLRDPLLALQDAQGNVLASDDDSGTGLDAQLVFTPTSSGSYVLEASSYGSGTGSYTLERSSRTNPDTARDDTATTARVNDGSSASGRVDFAGDLDWFAITLEAGRDYTFDLRSGFDNYLTLRDSSGLALTTDDDSGDGNNARLAFSATSSGTYYIEARAYSTRLASGDYTLTASSVATPVSTIDGAIPLAVGGSANGTLATTRDEAIYQFAVQAGRSYSLTVDTAAGSDPLDDPYVYLVDDDGNSLYDDDSGGDLDARLDFDVFGSGVLTAYVGGFDSGAFRIAVEILA